MTGKLRAVLLAGCVIMTPGAAFAQTAADEDGAGVDAGDIIVTAQKTSSSLQDTPLSIAVLGGAELAASGRSTEARDILQNVAGVTLSMSPFGALTINLRGVEGLTAPVTGKTDAGVAFNFDGVTVSSLLGNTSDGAFFDIARVEVLRGPQGTLYGRSAQAGVVNVITNDPTFERGMRGQLEVGNYSLVHASAAVNLPLSDQFAFRLAGDVVSRDSYFTSGLQDRKVQSLRGKLLYDNSDGVRVLLGAEYSHLGGAAASGGSGSFGGPGYALGDPPFNPYDDVTTDGGLTGQVPGSTRSYNNLKLWAKADIDLPFAQLTVLPSHVIVRNDQTLITKLAASAPGVYSPLPGFQNVDFTSIETRLSSLPGSKLNWILGVYYDVADATEKTTQFNRITTQKQDTLGFFGQATYPITDQLSFTAGLRQTRDYKRFLTDRILGTVADTSGARTWNRTDYRVGLDYEINRNSMVYASLSTGYRPGAVDITALPTVKLPDGSTVDNPSIFTRPESLRAYEIGTKNEFFGRTLTFNLSGYYYDYKDRQYNYLTTTADPNAPCPDGSAPQVQANGQVVCNIVFNAPKVRNYGVEAELDWHPTKLFRLGGSLAWLKSQIVGEQTEVMSIPVGATIPAGFVTSGQNVYVPSTGASSARAPEWEINAYAQYGIQLAKGALSLRGDMHYTSTFYINGYNYLNPAIMPDGTRFGDLYVAPSNTRFDASLRYAPDSGNWSVSVFAKNITKEIVKSQTDGRRATVEPPRTYGAVLSFDF